MTSLEKFENTYAILKNYRFNVEKDSNKDVFCTICNNVLINARNGPCGCRYCLDCISDYLSGGERFCPGRSDECKEEAINADRNLHTDQPINRKISKLIVKCPVETCEFTGELRRMDSHIRACDIKPVGCVFSDVGCKEMDITNESMKKHLLTEIVSHSKFLLESVDNLKNEFGLLQKDLANVKAENKELKKENDNLKREVNSIKIENEVIKRTLSQFENKLLINENRIKSVEERSSVKQVDRTTSPVELKSIEAKINRLETKIDNFEGSHQSENYGEFVWVVDNWNEKLKEAKAGIKTDIYSDAFYSHKNGYKLCLSISPNGSKTFLGKYLSVGVCLMRSVYDDILLWPFKQDVTIELINQNSGKPFRSCVVSFGSDDGNSSKPTSERNGRNGFLGFLSLEELSANRSLTNNNRIYFKCSIKSNR